MFLLHVEIGLCKKQAASPTDRLLYAKETLHLKHCFIDMQKHESEMCI